MRQSGTESSAGGGALAYTNTISVTPGENITVVVGAGGHVYNNNNRAGDSSFGSVCVAGAGTFNQGGQVLVGDGGGAGGNGGGLGAGGGGAGGYTGAGGNGAGKNNLNELRRGGDATGGGGGGGAGSNSLSPNNARGGAGVGLYGLGDSGEGGNEANGFVAQGGSGGGDGSDPNSYNGGQFGGGAGFRDGGGGFFGAVVSGHGAVRVVWPGVGREFPSKAIGSVKGTYANN